MSGSVPKYDDAELARLAARVGRQLLASSGHVTTAESCTGGWIAKALTDVPGSSQWFGEGFVTYSNEAKVRRLGVPRSALRTHGAVSEVVARAMARGALKRAGASPGGRRHGHRRSRRWSARKAGRDGVVLLGGESHGRRVRLEAERKRFRGNRETVRRKTVRWALAGLLSTLRSSGARATILRGFPDSDARPALDRLGRRRRSVCPRTARRGAVRELPHDHRFRRRGVQRKPPRYAPSALRCAARRSTSVSIPTSTGRNPKSWRPSASRCPAALLELHRALRGSRAPEAACGLR